MRQRWQAAIALELDRLSAEFAALGGRLADDAAVLERHPVALQDFDRWTQQAEELARLLRTDVLEDALIQCGNRAMAARIAGNLEDTPGASLDITADEIAHTIAGTRRAAG